MIICADGGKVWAVVSEEGLKTPVAFIKTSFVDFPEKLASVIFFPFCDLRCPWCHNGGLLSGKIAPDCSLREALALIEKRKKLLGGVVLSGGEALLFAEISELAAFIKKIPLAVKLDTNGANPSILRSLCRKKESMPDFIALDLKLAPSRYGETGASKEMPENLRETISLIREYKIPAEFRTLVLPPDKFSKDDVHELSRLLLNDEKKRWIFRPFRPGNCLDPAWDNYPPVPESRAAGFQTMNDE